MSFKVVSFNDTKNNNLEETHDIVNKDTSNIQLEMDEENYETEYQKPKIKKTRHQVSYDDILNSLGFGVSNGALYKNTTNLQQPYYNTQNMQNTQKNNESLDPRIKNSAIYNKYFKNYKDPNEIQEPEIPLTPQQQRIKMVKDYIEYQQARKRISQIKSKKMFYSTQNISISNQPNQPNPVNLNKLFIFSNRK